jgi:hypothetical protein
MSRITPSQHYERYQFLRTAWREFNKLYALLSLRQQWQIHEFYQPSKELTQAELTAHIKELHHTNPALVHQAGKHVHLMMRVFRHISSELGVPKLEQAHALNTLIQRVNPSPVVTTKNDRRLTIAAVARPTPDMDKLAKALVMLAKQMNNGDQSNAK